MSPSETSRHASLLEHPQEAFAYYRNEGVPAVICEQKHMGSRAVVILCCDERTRNEPGLGAQWECPPNSA
jgi:protein phosphatase